MSYSLLARVIWPLFEMCDDQRAMNQRKSREPNTKRPQVRPGTANDAETQARRTLRRNDALVKDQATPDAQEEANIAGVRTESSSDKDSGVSRGDYSND